MVFLPTNDPGLVRPGQWLASVTRISMDLMERHGSSIHIHIASVQTFLGTSIFYEAPAALIAFNMCQGMILYTYLDDILIVGASHEKTRAVQ